MDISIVQANPDDAGEILALQKMAYQSEAKWRHCQSVDRLQLAAAQDHQGGALVVDERGLKTMDGVWAGGDITSGGATVISAMGAGKTAAADMDVWLRKDGK
jgi:NADPH-dependent glutamate synthase beta subunit-like oxidoreductase